MISLIIECIDNGKNELIINSDELIRFYEDKVKGHKTILGRKMWDFLPFDKKSLGDLIPIVITKWRYDHEDIQTADSLEDAISYIDKEEEGFIIGGVSIFNEALKKINLIDKIYLCILDGKKDGKDKLDLLALMKDRWVISSTYTFENAMVIELEAL